MILGFCLSFSTLRSQRQGLRERPFLRSHLGDSRVPLTDKETLNPQSPLTAANGEGQQTAYRHHQRRSGGAAAANAMWTK